MQSENTSGRGLWAKLRGGRFATTFTVLAALSAGILAGSVVTGRVHGMESQKIDSSDARPLSIPSPVTLSNGFSEIVKQVGPAVVNINTEELPKPSKRSGRNGLQRGPLQAQPQTPDGGDDNEDQQGNMQDFFNRFFGGKNGGEAPDQGERQALGSGFIVDSRGYILTNNHVVDKADHIWVKLSTDPDGGPGDHGRPATVIGVDKETDIAVIKIDTKNPLPTIKLGNSDGAQVGDWVLAIGSPFGLSQTVSAGIVSAKNRTIEESEADGISRTQFQKFIQTDAAINPGNSGGPLVSMAGEVIGMNTAIYTQSQGSEGVGFAMPSNTLINVYNMLIGPDHKVTRGSIGITFQAAHSSAVDRMYGYGSGVIINTVTPGFRAAKAGLQPHDVITSVNGKSVKDGDELVAIISALRPGSTVKLGYTRNGKQDVATVGIADRAKLNAEAGLATNDNGTPDQPDAGQSKLGISVQPAPQAAITKLGIKGGVVVTAVKPGSFAEDIQLFQGSIITEINHQPVTDMASYNAIVSSLKSGSDVVFVVRDPRIKGGGDSLLGGTLP